MISIVRHNNVRSLKKKIAYASNLGSSRNDQYCKAPYLIAEMPWYGRDYVRNFTLGGHSLRLESADHVLS